MNKLILIRVVKVRDAEGNATYVIRGRFIVGGYKGLGRIRWKTLEAGEPDLDTAIQRANDLAEEHDCELDY